MVGQTFDKEKVSLNIARLKKEGETFEIDINPEAALNFKEGKIADVAEALKTKEIFSDVKKGLATSPKRLEAVFGTDDTLKIAEIILKDGEIQLTQEQREQMRVQILNKIVTMISRDAFNPQTNTPHPPERIKDAIKEAKIKIDENLKAEDQVQNVINALKPILPISIEKKKFSVTVPAEFAAKSYSILERYTQINNQNWNQDGSLTAEVIMPAGLQDKFFDDINNLTHGKVTIEEVK